MKINTYDINPLAPEAGIVIHALPDDVNQRRPTKGRGAKAKGDLGDDGDLEQPAKTVAHVVSFNEIRCPPVPLEILSLRSIQGHSNR